MSCETKLAYVAPFHTPAWSKGGRSEPERVVPGWWEAHVYGVMTVRACPLDAFAAACEKWLAERKDTP